MEPTDEIRESLKRLPPYDPSKDYKALHPTKLLPNKPGWYLWYICDLGGLAVGAVQVLKDHQTQLDYLNDYKKKMKATNDLGHCSFYVYQTEDGTWLTMYFQNGSIVPPRDLENYDGLPLVDGYREFDFNWLMEDEDKEIERQIGIKRTYPKS